MGSSGILGSASATRASTNKTPSWKNICACTCNKHTHARAHKRVLQVAYLIWWWFCPEETLCAATEKALSVKGMLMSARADGCQSWRHPRCNEIHHSPSSDLSSLVDGGHALEDGRPHSPALCLQPPVPHRRKEEGGQRRPVLLALWALWGIPLPGTSPEIKGLAMLWAMLELLYYE